MTEPNLRFPAAFCEKLRFSAKICGFLRFPAPSKISRRRGESAKICGESAKICVLGSLFHLGSVPLSAPRWTLEVEGCVRSSKGSCENPPFSEGFLECVWQCDLEGGRLLGRFLRGEGVHVDHGSGNDYTINSPTNSN